jgi:hypothetical protein
MVESGFESDALWLPGQDGDEQLLIGELVRALSQWSCVSTGTWYEKDGVPRGLDKYPGLQERYWRPLT